MAFFNFRSRDPQAKEASGRKPAAAAAAPAESVEAMRRRARHRLLGAAVLVLVGVIGFPLLFDTQPRPISVDIPIEIPDRTKTPPLVQPASQSSASGNVAAAPGGSAQVAAASSSGEMITETADGNEVAPEKAEAKPSAAPPKPEAKPEAKPEPKPEAHAEAKPEPKPAAKPTASSDDAARARALLNGKTPEVVAKADPAPAAADAGRFVVQVGAFNDADKARDVRQRLEKAGIKTYISVAKTASGEWTRVRAGPFGSRAEAEKVAEKVKGLSMSAAILTL